MKQLRTSPPSPERARAPHPRNLSSLVKPLECWQQDPDAPDLWHGDEGVIVNTAALEERAFYFEIVRVHTATGRVPKIEGNRTATY